MCGSAAAIAVEKDTEHAGVQEKESTDKPQSKKKRFLPFLLIGAGIVASGVLVYILVIKKPKYTLEVRRSEGVDGTPEAGNYTYKKGSKVNYSFSPRPGYKNLSVQLDGAPVPASGVVDMSGNHTLIADAAHLVEYTLSVNRGTGVNGAPDTGSYKYAEGSRIDYAYTLQSGFQNLKVTLDGAAAPAAGSVIMDNNHSLSASASESEQYYKLEVKVSPLTITGYPAPGTYWYLKGTVVEYYYEFTSGNFYVYLDTVLQCASPLPPNAKCSGSFVMNGNRLLDIVGD